MDSENKDHQDDQEQQNVLKEKMEMRRKQQVHFIMTQTNYDENEATEKLKTYNNDVMKVVSEYLGISPKEDEHINKTKNQKVYTVIREIMDKGSRNYQMQQERAKKIEEIKKMIEYKNKKNDNKDPDPNPNEQESQNKITKEKID
jgi:hypothetical protein